MFPKPDHRKARRRRQRDAQLTERLAKAQARLRDGYRSRWPGTAHIQRVEVAHLKAKGMGGSASANVVSNLITLAASIHQGPRSLHSGHRRILPLTSAGTSGPCAFFERDTLSDIWQLIGHEIEVGRLAAAL